MNNTQARQLMKWRARYKRAQWAHNESAISYGNYHLWVGLLLVLLTAIAGVITFWSPPEAYKLVPVVIAVLATVVASLQTFLKFSEQSETHRSSARRYGELKKEIEYVICFDEEIDDFAKRVDSVRQKEAAVAQDSPNALKRHWDRASKITEDENERHSIRRGVNYMVRHGKKTI